MISPHDLRDINEHAPKYSLSHLTLLNCSTPELAYIAARAGYDAINPRLIPLGVEGEYPFSLLDGEMMRATRNALKVTGIEVQAIELARITDRCEVESFEPAIESGAELGARQLIASAWTTGPDDRSYIIDTFAEICELAASYGCSVSLEFPSFSRLNTLQETAEIVKAANKPNGGILVDLLYMHMSKIDPAELEPLPPEWFNHIHVCDSVPEIPETITGMIRIARNSRLYPGEGSIDFKSIIECLPPVGYCIEIPNKRRVAELGYEEHARRSLQAAKQTLASIRSKRIEGSTPHI